MIIQKIRDRKPLVHCLTNYVVANFTANGLLAIGASPVMADEINEVAEILSDTVLLNIGTVNTFLKESMIVVGKEANKRQVPVVLDPVGVGATSFRKSVVEEILGNVQVDLIRCNVGELATIANCETWQSRGVDSGDGELNVEEVAKQVAIQYKCLVAVTGEKDIVTDGVQVLTTSGGSVRMTEVTGTGCLLGALCAAVLTVEGNMLKNLHDLLSDYKKLAEAINADYIGDFQIEILNQLDKMSKEV